MSVTPDSGHVSFLVTSRGPLLVYGTRLLSSGCGVGWGCGGGSGTEGTWGRRTMWLEVWTGDIRYSGGDGNSGGDPPFIVASSVLRALGQKHVYRSHYFLYL